MVGSKKSYSVSVANLIQGGLLTVGDELLFEPRLGERFEGRIRAGGSLSFNGEPFSSPSGAANALARKSGKFPNDSRNGWKEILVRGQSLAHHRDQYLHKRGDSTPVPTVEPPSPVFPSVGRQSTSAEGAPSVPEAQESIRVQVLGRLSAMSDREFEEFVGRVLVRLGYEDVQVVGRSNDRGLDVECLRSLPLVEPPIRIACQVKQHSGTVGGSVVGDLRGRWAHKADRLILVNLGGFSAGAREEAGEQPGAKAVKLVSGNDLVDLMAQEGIGVQREPVVIESLDETFFSPFSS